MWLFRGKGPKAEARFFPQGAKGWEVQCPPPPPAPPSLRPQEACCAPLLAPRDQRIPRGPRGLGAGLRCRLDFFIKSISPSRERPGSSLVPARGKEPPPPQASSKAGPPPPSDRGGLGGVTRAGPWEGLGGGGV